VSHLFQLASGPDSAPCSHHGTCHPATLCLCPCTWCSASALAALASMSGVAVEATEQVAYGLGLNDNETELGSGGDWRGVWWWCSKMGQDGLYALASVGRKRWSLWFWLKSSIVWLHWWIGSICTKNRSQSRKTKFLDSETETEPKNRHFGSILVQFM
jgi:hypothetical protein